MIKTIFSHATTALLVFMLNYWRIIITQITPPMKNMKKRSKAKEPTASATATETTTESKPKAKTVPVDGGYKGDISEGVTKDDLGTSESNPKSIEGAKDKISAKNKDALKLDKKPDEKEKENEKDKEMYIVVIHPDALCKNGKELTRKERENGSNSIHCKQPNDDDCSITNIQELSVYHGNEQKAINDVNICEMKKPIIEGMFMVYFFLACGAVDA
eukprot:6664_1